MVVVIQHHSCDITIRNLSMSWYIAQVSPRPKAKWAGSFAPLWADWRERRAGEKWWPLDSGNALREVWLGNQSTDRNNGERRRRMVLCGTPIYQTIIKNYIPNYQTRIKKYQISRRWFPTLHFLPNRDEFFDRCLGLIGRPAANHLCESTYVHQHQCPGAGRAVELLFWCGWTPKKTTRCAEWHVEKDGSVQAEYAPPHEAGSQPHGKAPTVAPKVAWFEVNYRALIWALVVTSQCSAVVSLSSTGTLHPEPGWDFLAPGERCCL